MSVAFRRDGDEEHKEPRFELPIPPGPNRVTPRGLLRIEAEVRDIEAEIAARAGGAEGEGSDLHRLRRALRYWHTRLATAEPTRAPVDGSAGFGTRVTFRLNGAERTIAIVGADEADPHGDRIAFTAPLARALTGAEAGETVDFAGKADAIAVLAVAAIGDEAD